MKLILILLSIVLLSSCGPDHRPVINYKEPNVYNKCLCDFNYDAGGWSSIHFVDSCSLYHIGDTIYPKSIKP